MRQVIRTTLMPQTLVVRGTPIQLGQVVKAARVGTAAASGTDSLLDKTLSWVNAGLDLYDLRGGADGVDFMGWGMLEKGVGLHVVSRVGSDSERLTDPAASDTFWDCVVSDAIGGRVHLLKQLSNGDLVPFGVRVINGTGDALPGLYVDAVTPTKWRLTHHDATPLFKRFAATAAFALPALERYCAKHSITLMTTGHRGDQTLGMRRLSSTTLREQLVDACIASLSAKLSSSVESSQVRYLDLFSPPEHAATHAALLVKEEYGADTVSVTCVTQRQEDTGDALLSSRCDFVIGGSHINAIRALPSSHYDIATVHLRLEGDSEVLGGHLASVVSAVKSGGFVHVLTYGSRRGSSDWWGELCRFVPPSITLRVSRRIGVGEECGLGLSEQQSVPFECCVVHVTK